VPGQKAALVDWLPSLGAKALAVLLKHWLTRPRATFEASGTQSLASIRSLRL